MENCTPVIWAVKQVKTIGIISDLHVPFQDDKAVNKAMNILKDEKPETIVVDGDLIDCWEVSKFNQVPKFGVELDQEVEAGYSILADLRKEHPNIELLSIGSALKICMVAEGKADIYPRLGLCMEWDTAAAHAVVNFSGKKIYQFESDKELVYNKENLLNPWFIVK